MKFKTRLFLFVAIVFLLMQTISLVSSYVEVNNHVNSLKVELEGEIRENNRKQAEDYRAFVTLSLAEIELRINALFFKITNYEWLKERYEPSVFNYETNQWSNSVILIAKNQWLDFVQTTVKDKLTSLILMRPPYLYSMFEIPLKEGITLVAGVNISGEIDVFIGVPYWSKAMKHLVEEGMEDTLFSLDTSRSNWLLFTPEQLINADLKELHLNGTYMVKEGLATAAYKKKREAYQTLIDDTIHNFEETRMQLLRNPEVIKNLRNPKWVSENISEKVRGKHEILPKGISSCDSHICNKLKESKRADAWTDLHDFKERDDQNRLAWELGTITGMGLWNYDPSNKFAPKAIASFKIKDQESIDYQNPMLGYGIYSGDIFLDKAIPINAGCSPKFVAGKVNTCISPSYELIRSHFDERSVFAVNTLVYEDAKVPKELSSGTLSAGVNITPVLEKLALISPDEVLLLTKEGRPLVFNTHGELIHSDLKEDNVYSDIRGKKEGIFTDENGRRLYFLHITTISETDGYIYILQDKDAVFRKIDELEKQATKLLYDIAFQLLVIGAVVLFAVLLIINFFVKRMVKPIQDLAEVTQDVAAGNLDEITFSKKDKLRKDEVGILVNSFEDMVNKMKEGNQVRAILHKVVNKDVADKILKEGVELGGEVRQVAVIFSDIRDFTHISEKMAPQDVLAMLNDCLTVLSRVIDDHKGVIDKYVGDEIMALFGAPIECENVALHAIECAVAMMRVLVEWNRHRRSIGYCELKIGIGVHVGEVIAGNMGAENHLNYTILGHNVNLAARLCDHAGEMEILITEDALNSAGVKDAIEVESMPQATFKGISKPVTIFRVKY